MIHVADVRGEKEGELWLSLPTPNNYAGEKEALVEFQDGRQITPKQRRKAYVLINAIAAWAGYIPAEAEKALLKSAFLAGGATLKDSFSLASCSMTEARLFITWLLEFCLLHSVPLGESPLNSLVEDIPRFVYFSLLAKKCAICGKKADLHHFDVLGMGADRRTINHLGLRALPLCREHHMEIHSCGGQEIFLKKYHLEPVAIDERIAEAYGLNTK